MRWLLLLGGTAGCAAAVLLACSGSDTASPASAAPDSSDDGANASADAAPADDRILPVALGRSWTYELSPLDGGTIICPGSPTAQVTGQGDVHDGGTSLRYHPLCLAPPAEYVDLVGAGDQLLAYLYVDGGGSGPVNGSAPYVYTDAPVADGHEWLYGSGITQRWRDAGPITVKAGTFTDCWRREDVAPADGTYVVFCRGVGQVYHFNVAGHYTAELTAKSF